jgi:hypothetical protein
VGWKAVPQTDPFLSQEADQPLVSWAPVKVTAMVTLAGCLCLGLVVVCAAGGVLAALAHSSSSPDLSMSSLPIGGQWRIVVESTSTSQSGGCENGSICIAYGVISPTTGLGVSEAEATLVTRLRRRGWACTTPHPGGSIAMVSPNGHSWTEMEPVDDIDVATTDPADIMAKAAQTAPYSTAGLAVWINSSRDPTAPTVLPIHNGGCPEIRG